MTNLQTYLQTKLRGILSSWDEEGIYAISFFVSANPAQEYGGRSNVTEFCVSYNTESDCAGAGALSEERWNYAFWRQNETPVILADEDDEGMKTLFAWYAENGVENIGYEDPAASYDSEMRYIGKGPAGYYELLTQAAPPRQGRCRRAALSGKNSAGRSRSSSTIWSIRGMFLKRPEPQTPTAKPTPSSPQ